ncbi:MAG TPA: dUTP diphosphatase [Polyangiaceae bacterium]|jgi:dUTP pyrophosphatase|nr:dUTP diphosphatase [Polyangiaceae bacterium]
MAERLQVEVTAMHVGTTETSAPVYQSLEAAGMDLPAAVSDDVVIAPGGRALIPTGWAFAIPHGFEGQVRPRSGLALRHGVTVLNAPGTIDADYRGEVKVVLVNFGADPFTVRRGDRIAQLVVAPVAKVTLRVAASLDPTDRGHGGYGSTGVEPPTSRRA